MEHAIRLGRLGLTVTFSFEDQVQLTAHGLRRVLVTIARVFEAKGLKLIGQGVSIKSPDEPVDDFKKAMAKALGRALGRMQQLTPDDRKDVMSHLAQTLAQTNLVEEYY